MALKQAFLASNVIQNIKQNTRIATGHAMVQDLLARLPQFVAHVGLATVVHNHIPQIVFIDFQVEL